MKNQWILQETREKLSHERAREEHMTESWRVVLGSRFIAKPIVKNEENLCCNHVVVPDFVPIVSSTSKDKNWYTFLHAKEIKKWRERLLSQNLCLGLILGI